MKRRTAQHTDNPKPARRRVTFLRSAGTQRSPCRETQPRRITRHKGMLFALRPRAAGEPQQRSAAWRKRTPCENASKMLCHEAKGCKAQTAAHTRKRALEEWQEGSTAREALRTKKSSRKGGEERWWWYVQACVCGGRHGACVVSRCSKVVVVGKGRGKVCAGVQWQVVKGGKGNVYVWGSGVEEEMCSVGGSVCRQVCYMKAGKACAGGGKGVCGVVCSVQVVAGRRGRCGGGGMVRCVQCNAAVSTRQRQRPAGR